MATPTPTTSPSVIRRRPARRDPLALGLTAVLIGYSLVWLPGPGAGLSLIGLELGEWIKFLGFGPRRDWFYAPPIVLGLLLALWTATWPNGRRAWLARGLAVAVALLAFPAVAAITSEPRSEWLLRLALIALVGVVAVGVALPVARRGTRWVWAAMAIVALVGAIGPTWHYLAARSLVAAALRQPVGIGPGVWLNALGCLLVVGVCLTELVAGRNKNRQPSARKGAGGSFCETRRQPEWPLGAHPGVDVLDGFADGGDLLSFFVGNLARKLLLECHDQFDQVERVGFQFLAKARRGDHLVFIYAEQIDDNRPDSFFGVIH